MKLKHAVELKDEEIYQPQGVVALELGQYLHALKPNEELFIHGWEMSVHGHQGSNGAKGSLLSFRQLDRKMMVAHGHNPERADGVLRVGTSSKRRQGYNDGLSNHEHAHGIIHNDGKSQLLVTPNDIFTTLGKFVNKLK